MIYLDICIKRFEAISSNHSVQLTDDRQKISNKNNRFGNDFYTRVIRYVQLLLTPHCPHLYQIWHQTSWWCSCWSGGCFPGWARPAPPPRRCRCPRWGSLTPRRLWRDRRGSCHTHCHTCIEYKTLSWFKLLNEIIFIHSFINFV